MKFELIASRPVQGLSVLWITLLTSCIPSSNNMSEPVVIEPVGDSIVDVSAGDAAMQAAIDEARANIGQFIAHLEAVPGDASSTIKAPLDTGGQVEHIWIDHIQFDGEAFTGRLANEPLDSSTYQQGDEVRIPKEEISDWAFLDGDAMQGGYTGRVLEERTVE